MKKLLLLRHAKTEPINQSGSDLNRALTARGASDATRIGEYIRAQGIKIDLVLTSSARRAVQTSELVADAAGLNVPVNSDRRIYEAGIRELSQLLKEVDSQHDSVLVVGHNPAIEELVKWLTDAVQAMSAGTLAVLAFKGNEWSRLDSGTCTLESIITP